MSNLLLMFEYNPPIQKDPNPRHVIGQFLNRQENSRRVQNCKTYKYEIRTSSQFEK